MSRRTLISILLSMFMVGATHSIWGQTTGTIVVNFSITINSSIPSTAELACHAAAQVTDGPATGPKNVIVEGSTVAATRSGSSASCTVTLPYSWNLVTPTTDKIVLGYSVGAPGEVPPGSPGSLPARNTSQSRYAAIPVPAAGSTTTENLTIVF